MEEYAEQKGIMAQPRRKLPPNQWSSQYSFAFVLLGCGSCIHNNSSIRSIYTQKLFQHVCTICRECRSSCFSLFIGLLVAYYPFPSPFLHKLELSAVFCLVVKPGAVHKGWNNVALMFSRLHLRTFRSILFSSDQLAMPFTQSSGCCFELALFLRSSA